MNKRIDTLNFYKIVSALVIFLFHSNMHLGCYYYFFTPFVKQGAIFMIAFFVLSGFVLYYNYGERDMSSIKEIKMFYIKRLISIYPLYLFVYIFDLVTNNGETFLKKSLLLPIQLSLTQSLFDGSFSVGANGGTWFISCILFCYVLFPFIVIILSQVTNRTRIVILGLALFFSIISPFISNQFGFSNIYSNPLFRMLEFIIGMIISRLFQKSQNNIRNILIYILIEWGLLFLSISYLSTHEFGNYTLYGVIATPIFALNIYHVACLQNSKISNFLGNAIIKYLGDISYAFFIAQFTTWKIVTFIQGISKIEGRFANTKIIVLSFAICFFTAVILHEVIEKPIKKILFLSRRIS